MVRATRSMRVVGTGGEIEALAGLFEQAGRFGFQRAVLAHAGHLDAGVDLAAFGLAPAGGHHPITHWR